jgi:anti-sigma factor RsiW
MKTVPGSVGDDDLHAYVDGRLDASRAAAVEAFLAEHPEAASRVASWQAGTQALRNALAFKAAEPVPASLDLARLAALRSRRGAWSAPRMAAAIAMALLVGAGSGWVAHGPGQSTGLAALSQEATSVHQAFAEASQPYPEPISTTNTAELVSWATHRLGRKIAPPDLSAAGYTLLGGRLIATTHGSGCMFLYKDDGGNRITVFMRPMQRIDENAPMRPIDKGYVWARNGLGVSLISTAALPGLHSLSNAVRAQIGA